MDSLTRETDKKKSIAVKAKLMSEKNRHTRAVFIRACANIFHQTHSGMYAKDSNSFDFFFLFLRR